MGIRILSLGVTPAGVLSTDALVIARSGKNYRATPIEVVGAGLPAQSGNAGKVLTTDGGSTLSWVDPALDFGTRAANTVFSGPTSGSAAAPTFRALVTADIPSGIAHSGLSGLTSGDDHTQYALLAGRSGGQALIGGTASGNALILKSTSHATKGKIIFGAAGTTAYDEVNDRFGIGTATFGTVNKFTVNPNFATDNTANVQINGIGTQDLILAIQSPGSYTGKSGGGIAIQFQNSSGTELFAIQTNGVPSARRGTTYGQAYGFGALNATLTGEYNNAFGYQALGSCTSGSGNSAFGMDSMSRVDTGTSNNAFGYETLTHITSSFYNIAIGNQALELMTAAGEGSNIAIGFQTLQPLTTGTKNIVLGTQSGGGGSSGVALTTGIGNVLLGYQADTTAVGTNYGIALGYGAVASTNSLVVGSTTGFISNAYFGNGITNAAPQDITVNATGGVGTNISGANFIYAAGIPTGTGGVGGSHIWKGSLAGISTATAGTLSTLMTLSPAAILTLGLAGTRLGAFRLAGNTSGYVQLQSAAAAGSWTCTLPSSAGTNKYALTTNGSGVTSWAVNGSLPIFDHYTDVSNATTVETDLFTDTIAAAQLGANGDKLIAQYGGTFTGAVTSTQELKVYFGGTVIFDTGALAIGAVTVNWDFKVTIIRESSTVVRCSVSYTSSSTVLASSSSYARVTGLTLSGTNIVKVTGTAAGAAAASNQITAAQGYVEFKPTAS